MTREEEINSALLPILKKMREHGATDEMCKMYDNGFHVGAMWADKNPHWISVDDELPPRWETNPNVSVPVITFGTLGESSIPFVELQRYHFGDGKWQYGKATHWMHFQYPKKGGDNG